MLHNVVFSSGTSSFDRDWEYIAIDEILLNRLVEHYLKGIPEFNHVGVTYEVAQYYFQIYRPKTDFGLDANKVKNIFEELAQRNFGGRMDEKLFQETGTNVTNEFLKGREWGDLKDDLFIVYLNTDGKKRVKTAVEKNELMLFIKRWNDGEPNGWLEGTEIPLIKPTAFKVYKIDFKFRLSTKGETKKFLNKEKRDTTVNGWSTAIIEKFGADATSDFEIGSYGSKNQMRTSESSEKETIVQKRDGKIFISHSSKDKELVSQFIETILILGLGLKREDIFCTSDRGTDIKSGEDFKRVIKEELDGAKAVIQIVTKNYKTSEVCLNEMGAAWVISDKVIPLVAFPFNYDTGFIHASSQQLILNNKEHLLKFYDDHKEDLFPFNVIFTVFDRQVNKFIDFVNRIRLEDHIERRFFYNEEVSIKGKLLGEIFQHPNKSHHRFYFVLLNKTVDILSSQMLVEEGNFETSRFGVEAIQVGAAGQVEIDFKKYLNEEVIVTGICFGGHTAWHQTAVVMLANSISPIS